MSAPIVERLRDVHHTDYATRLEAADTITDLLAALEAVTAALNGRVHSRQALAALALCSDAIAKAKAVQP